MQDSPGSVWNFSPVYSAACGSGADHALVCLVELCQWKEQTHCQHTENKVVHCPITQNQFVLVQTQQMNKLCSLLDSSNIHRLSFCIQCNEEGRYNPPHFLVYLCFKEEIEDNVNLTECEANLLKHIQGRLQRSHFANPSSTNKPTSAKATSKRGGWMRQGSRWAGADSTDHHLRVQQESKMEGDLRPLTNRNGISAVSSVIFSILNHTQRVSVSP